MATRSRMAALFLVCLAALIQVPLHAQPDLTRLILDAPLIVRGTLAGADSPTLPLPPPGGRVFRLLVKDTLRGVDTIGSFNGQEIILGRTSTSARTEGVFFVRPIAYGKTLVAEEIGEIDPPSDSAAFMAQIARVRQQDEEDKLAARLGSAEAVIVGRVLSVRSAAAGPAVASEHDPQWVIAQVLVIRIITGQPKTGQCGGQTCVDVAFAHSDDIRWFRAPKVSVGQENIALLRPADRTVLHEREVPPATYVLIDPNDLRPVTEEPSLHGLIRRGQ